jgi:hypothetical protein
MQIVWEEEAERDLDRIVAYILQDDPAAALRMGGHHPGSSADAGRSSLQFQPPFITIARQASPGAYRPVTQRHCFYPIFSPFWGVVQRAIPT